jgi:GNAT superfamily N-acetyltransferase
MPAIIVRAATSADLPELTRLWHEKTIIQQQFDRRFSLLPDGAAHWSRAAAGWLLDDHCGIFVAERDASLLGYVIGWVKPAPVGLSPEQIGLVEDMSVDAHSHENGVGRLLIAPLKEWFATHGITALVTQVSHRQAVEQAFWRAQGAVEWVDLMWIKW